MIKPLLIPLLTLIFMVHSNVAYSQNEELSEKVISQYYQDHVPVGEFDSVLLDELQMVNTMHPGQIFMLCSKYVSKKDWNSASICFFIGRNRFRIYNKTNPEYEASGDGALAGSFAYLYGMSLTPYLNKNLENFAALLQISGEWYLANKHTYFEHPDYDSLYQLQVDGLLKNASELRNNPEKYIRQLENDPSAKYAARLDEILRLDSLSEQAVLLDFNDPEIKDSVRKFKNAIKEELDYFAAHRISLDSLREKDSLFPCEIDTYDGIYRVTIDNALGYYSELFAEYLLYENGYCWESIIIQYLHQQDDDTLLFADFDSESSTFVLYADNEEIQLDAANAIHELCSDESKFREFLSKLNRNLIDC